MKQFIVAGIGTEIGKTVVSAILTAGLKADYWKPVQAGDLDTGDAYWIRNWVPSATVHSSTYALTQPMSPHSAAEIDGITISVERFKIPTDKTLIVELAGGIMVPLNDQQTNLDLIKHLNLPVILVSKNYLGSLNHTLLSYELLKQHGVQMAGIVFNGPENPSGEKFILNHTGLPLILRVNQESEINEAVIASYANKIHV
ncbi:dethiobiotin synthase [Aquirufa sp. KTFRIE-69F]|uniref:ATP-dependent dethiobiotin synthetase BioD n=1 Tax=Aquirufa originis TaxID=3096514 RepID=A0ABW6D5W5_9BACT